MPRAYRPSSTSCWAAAWLMWKSKKKAFVVGPEERVLTEPATPIGWFPIRHEGRAVGGIAVFEMLSHKKCFEAEDLEILEMLSAHAATAIRSALSATLEQLDVGSFAEAIARIEGAGR